MARTIKTLGPLGSALLRAAAERQRYILTPEVVSDVLGLDKRRGAQELARLADHGWLLRLRRGVYLVLPLEAFPGAPYEPNEYVVGANLVWPYYLSYWTALRFYQVTEQVTLTLYIATERRGHGATRVWRIGSVTYRVVPLPQHKFFGWQERWVDSERVRVASPIKAIVDCLDRPEYSGGLQEVAKAVWHFRNEVRWADAINMAKRMYNGAILKRLGYLLEVLDLAAEVRAEMRQHLTQGYALLDPTLPNEGPYDTSWRVRVNIDPRDLTGWMRT